MSRPGRRHRQDARVPGVGVLALATAAGAVLLVRYQPGTAPAQAATVTSAPTAAPVAGVPVSGVLSGPAVPQPPVGRGRAVLGRVVSTQWGTIQVQLTVSGGRITSARAVRVPQIGGKQGERINTRAIARLDTQALRAQSARIDGVSGATVSSTGYRTSLQSALDAAHLTRPAAPPT